MPQTCEELAKTIENWINDNLLKQHRKEDIPSVVLKKLQDTIQQESHSNTSPPNIHEENFKQLITKILHNNQENMVTLEDFTGILILDNTDDTAQEEKKEKNLKLIIEYLNNMMQIEQDLQNNLQERIDKNNRYNVSPVSNNSSDNMKIFKITTIGKDSKNPVMLTISNNRATYCCTSYTPLLASSNILDKHRKALECMRQNGYNNIKLVSNAKRLTKNSVKIWKNQALAALQQQYTIHEVKNLTDSQYISSYVVCKGKLYYMANADNPIDCGDASNLFHKEDASLFFKSFSKFEQFKTQVVQGTLYNALTENKLTIENNKLIRTNQNNTKEELAELTAEQVKALSNHINEVKRNYNQTSIQFIINQLSGILPTNNVHDNQPSEIAPGLYLHSGNVFNCKSQPTWNFDSVKIDLDHGTLTSKIGSKKKIFMETEQIITAINYASMCGTTRPSIISPDSTQQKSTMEFVSQNTKPLLQLEAKENQPEQQSTGQPLISIHTNNKDDNPPLITLTNRH